MKLLSDVTLLQRNKSEKIQEKNDIHLNWEKNENKMQFSYNKIENSNHYILQLCMKNNFNVCFYFLFFFFGGTVTWLI